MAGYDPITQTKLCNGCGERKPVSEFYLHKSGNRHTYPDPYVHRCKPCLSIYYAGRYKTVPSIKERLRRFDQSEKGRDYHREKQRRPNHVARMRAYQQRPEQVEKRRAYAKIYWQRPEQKERAKAAQARRRAWKTAAGGSYTKQDVAVIRRMQKGKCAICRERLQPDYHVDHITPISKGGHSNPSNLQLLCATCNHRKNNKDPIDYMQSIGRLL